MQRLLLSIAMMFLCACSGGSSDEPALQVPPDVKQSLWDDTDWDDAQWN